MESSFYLSLFFEGRGIGVAQGSRRHQPFGSAAPTFTNSIGSAPTFSNTFAPQPPLQQFSAPQQFGAPPMPPHSFLIPRFGKIQNGGCSTWFILVWLLLYALQQKCHPSIHPSSVTIIHIYIHAFDCVCFLNFHVCFFYLKDSYRINSVFYVKKLKWPRSRL